MGLGPTSPAKPDHCGSLPAMSMGIDTTFEGSHFSCGEQACPALGCEAAPDPDAEFFQENCSAFTGAASQPNAGQACSPQQPTCHITGCIDTYAAMRACQAKVGWLTGRYRRQASSNIWNVFHGRSLIVPTLCVGMPPWTLRVRSGGVTQSLTGCIPTQSVGTICV